MDGHKSHLCNLEVVHLTLVSRIEGCSEMHIIYVFCVKILNIHEVKNKILRSKIIYAKEDLGILV